MATIKKIEELEIWQTARKLNIKISVICEQDDIKRDFRFCSQIKASAGSIMDNIAEGFERTGNKEFKHFLIIAKASAGELKSQLYRLLDTGKLDATNFTQIVDCIEILSKRIGALIKYLENSDIKGRRYK